MYINIDASRDLKFSASCCKIMYRAESSHLEGSPWHLGLRNGTIEYGITSEIGTLFSISLEVFSDADYASKVTVCGRYQVERLCEEVLLYVDFPGLRMRYPFDFRSRVRCSRGYCKGVVVFETGLAFYVAW